MFECCTQSTQMHTCASYSVQTFLHTQAHAHIAYTNAQYTNMHIHPHMCGHTGQTDTRIHPVCLGHAWGSLSWPSAWPVLQKEPCTSPPSDQKAGLPQTGPWNLALFLLNQTPASLLPCVCSFLPLAASVLSAELSADGR